MFSTWSTDVRWTKLRQFETNESSGNGSEKRKISQSDESDDEWLAQLERDYAASARKRHRGRCSFFERCLIAALTVTVIITVILASLMISKNYGVSIKVLSGRPNTAVCQSKGCISASYSIINKIDDKVSPCKDFYQYSCGKWLEEVSVPNENTKYTSFHRVSQRNIVRLKKILDQRDLGLNDSSKVIQKVKDYYTACMKSGNDNRSEPIINLIRDIGSCKLTGGNSWTAESWNFEQALSKMHKLQSTPLFYMFVAADDKNSSENIIQIQQAGITLADREYYFKNESDKVISAYKSFMVKIGHLLGGDLNTTKIQMDEVYQFEKKLAEIYEPKQMLRDSEAVYHRMTVEDLQQLAPAIPWMDYMNNIFSLPVGHNEPVVVYTPTFLKNMSELVIRTDRRILANYMVWHLIKPLLSELSKPYKDAALDFLKIEQGIEGGAPMWKSCVTKTDSVLGFATGYLYIKRHDGKDVKNKAEEMISNIKESFIDNLSDVKWMDQETKQLAKEKIDAVFNIIGYPEWIEEPNKLDQYYEALSVSPDDSFENYLNARRFYHQRTMDRRGKTVDRKEWHMTPIEVNAYYSAPNNYIAFPSGILQRPFFDSEFPEAVNYGAIGVVMGHELTHGFDDKGQKFDKYGNLVSWRKNESAVTFRELASCMVDQYGNYTVNSKNVNGRQTLGENIADNGGLKLAYKAYQRWVQNNGNELNLPGLNLTTDQLFFLGFAQVWCSASRDSGIQNALLTDVHSPERVRVQAAISNSQEFSKAFNCPLNSPMNPQHKCSVW